MDAEEVLQRFQHQPADKATYRELTAYLQAAPTERIDAFALAALVDVPSGGTFFDQALSHVSREGFQRLVERSLALLESGASGEAVESVFAYASQQFPGDLRPYLQRLFPLAPNAGAYYENWPWRGAEAADLDWLFVQLSGGAGGALKAWECLMEARNVESMAAAIAAVAPAGSHQQQVQSALRTVGFRTPQERLYAQTCEHLVFPPGFVTRDNLAAGRSHPTWHLAAGSDRKVRFGGWGAGRCGLCGQRLHHLISLPSSRVFDGADTAATTALEVCLSCVGWEEGVLFYRHAADGVIESLDVGSAQPEFVAGPLQEAVVRLAPTPARWFWQDWALSNGRENLNRVGGHPAWVQSADFPDCSCCGSTMHFLLQLDSELPTDDGGEWLWGSGGVGYVFRCSACRVTAYRWQCT